MLQVVKELPHEQITFTSLVFGCISFFIVLILVSSVSVKIWCRKRDSNSHASQHWLLRPGCLPIPPSRQGFYSIAIRYNNLVGRARFELAKTKSTDLQSAPFDRSGIDPNMLSVKWSHLSELNRRPSAYKAGALPAELKWLIVSIYLVQFFCTKMYTNIKSGGIL